MGLLSKVKQVAGVVKSGVVNKVTSSLGAAKAVASKMTTSGGVVNRAKSMVTAAKSSGVVSKVMSVAGPVALAGTAFKTAEVAGRAIGQSSRAKYEARQARKRAAAGVAVPAVTPTPSTKSAGTIASIINYAQENPVKTGAMIAGGAAALYGIEQIAEAAGVRGGAGFIGARRRKKRKSKKRTRRSARRTARRSRRRSKRHGYGTAKQYRRKGGKSVYYTKNGQPYIKLASGKARFVKK